MTTQANVVNLIGAANKNDVARRAKSSSIEALVNSLNLCAEIPYSHHKQSNIPFKQIREILKDVLVKRINYAERFVGNWRTAITVDLADVTHIVEHKRGFSAYNIPADETDTFLFWVCQVWEDKNAEPKAAQETSSEYLERILVKVHTVEDFMNG